MAEANTENLSSKPLPPQPRLTDSPWFWANLFCTMGLVMLFLMNSNYNLLQTHAENDYRYGARSLERPPGATLADPTGARRTASGAAADSQTADSPTAAAADQPLDDPKAQPTIISLVPLRIAVGFAMLFTWGGMQWSYQRRKTQARAEP
jgi:hypothetical protein